MYHITLFADTMIGSVMLHIEHLDQWEGSSCRSGTYTNSSNERSRDIGVDVYATVLKCVGGRGGQTPNAKRSHGF